MANKGRHTRGSPKMHKNSPNSRRCRCHTRPLIPTTRPRITTNQRGAHDLLPRTCPKLVRPLAALSAWLQSTPVLPRSSMQTNSGLQPLMLRNQPLQRRAINDNNKRMIRAHAQRCAHDGALQRKCITRRCKNTRARSELHIARFATYAPHETQAPQ